MARFQNILETVGHTPVVRINRLAPDGVNLYVKVEAFNPLGSVKDRLALGVIEAAEQSGELKPGQTVIEATSGNTGIGLAMVCAAKGYPLVLTMAETFSVERRRLMRFLGAKVVLTPAAERAVGMIKKTIELAEARITLPHVLRFNEPVNAERQKWVSEALGRPNDSAADVVAALIASLGLPATLRDVGVKPEQLDEIAAGSMHDRWVHTNPRKIDGPPAVRALLDAAW